MIEKSAPNAEYLDRPDVRSRLRSRPVATCLGARRGAAGYAVLVFVAVAAAVDAWRTVSPWLGVVLALVAAQALVDWLVCWYRVGTLAYRNVVDPVDRGGVGPDGESGTGP